MEKMLNAEQPGHGTVRKSRKALPKELKGWVCHQTVRHGNRTYGPYWYRFWREDGRLRKAYVKPCDLDEVRRACKEWQEHQELMRYERSLSRQSRSFFTDLEKSLKALYGY
jgi:hypothetical protein